MIPNLTCLILFGRLSTTCSFIPSLVAVDSMAGKYLVTPRLLY